MHKEETNQTTLKKKKEEDFLFQKNNVIIQMEFKLEKKKTLRINNHPHSKRHKQNTCTVRFKSSVGPACTTTLQR